MWEMLSVVGLGLTAAALAVVLRQYKPEYALLVTLGAGCLSSSGSPGGGTSCGRLKG